MTKSSDGKKIILRADNSSYCCLWNTDGVFHMEAVMSFLNDWCKFSAFEVDNKLVLKGHNGRYICRWHTDGVDSIEASVDGVNEYCKFTPQVGDVIPPSFDIIDVSWDSIATPVIYNPTVVTEDTYINDSSNEIVQVFDL